MSDRRAIVLLAWWILVSHHVYKVKQLGPYPSKAVCLLAGATVMPTELRFMSPATQRTFLAFMLSPRTAQDEQRHPLTTQQRLWAYDHSPYTPLTGCYWSAP